jgi:hypothetical protein
MFYTFNQNNSGGSFTRSDNVDHYVSVEGNSIDEVIKRALIIGIYFNGCDSGWDCSCCGDRWYPPYDDDDLVDAPGKYDTPFCDPVDSVKDPSRHTVVIHYADGRIGYTTSNTGNADMDRWGDLALR